MHGFIPEETKILVETQRFFFSFFHLSAKKNLFGLVLLQPGWE